MTIYIYSVKICRHVIDNYLIYNYNCTGVWKQVIWHTGVHLWQSWDKISQNKSHTCSQLYFLSPCTATAGGYVQALITICNRQVWLNITTPERRDTNFPFSGLISLFNHLCDLLWGWRLGFYQHKEEDWVQIQSHIPLANRSEAEPSPRQPIGRQIDGDVIIEQSSACATKTAEMSAKVKTGLSRVIVYNLCRCPLTASPRPFTNSNSLEWRKPDWWQASRPPRLVQQTGTAH